jgi:hypothetical protein
MARSNVKAAAASAVILFVGAVSASSLGSFLPPGREVFVRAGVSAAGQGVENTLPPKPAVEHLKTPNAVKGVYLSQCGAASPELRGHILSLVDETELNAIVVDLKDFTGTVAFPSETALPGGAGCTIKDFRALVENMHARGIYVIGRMTVFQDPMYTNTYPEQAVRRASDPSAVWKDYKGLSFVDVGARPFWDYIVALSREAHALGVDEINFDYIRYPSDGNMRDVHYVYGKGEKPVELEKFFQYLSREMRSLKGEDGHTPVLSADLFGMTTTNPDDLNIGQVMERALPYFDYIAPMVYPSHYPPQFNGWANPNEHVYGVVKYSMDKAVPRTIATTTPLSGFTHERIGTSTPPVYAKQSYPATALRPWLQDFDYGGDYGPKEVRDQIQAVYDAGLTSWMLWDPSNKYTRDALKPE